MKNKREFIKELTIIIVGGIVLSAAVIFTLWWALDKQGSKCDEAMGHTCSIYEIDNYNWERK